MSDKLKINIAVFWEQVGVCDFCEFNDAFVRLDERRGGSKEVNRRRRYCLVCAPGLVQVMAGVTFRGANNFEYDFVFTDPNVQFLQEAITSECANFPGAD